MWNHGLFFLALLAMVFAIGGVGWFAEGIALRRMRRLLENLPTSDIRSMPTGLVEVKGTAQWKEALSSPISETPCVYYAYKVEQWQYRKDGSRWVIIALGDSGERLFYIEDNTGRALVDPVGAEISSPADNVRTYNDYRDLPQHLKSLLDQEDNRLLRLMRKDRGALMFTENYIGIDQEIYILGTAVSNPDHASKTGRREENSLEDIVIQRGKAIPVFYISDRSETEISRRMNRSSIRRLLGGPITLAICSLLIYHYYKFSLQYIHKPLEISLLFKWWILLGPVVLVVIMFFFGYRYSSFTKALIRSQGN